MATGGREIEVLPETMSVADASKGPYLLNMERFGGRWMTRAGFGQVTQFDTTFAFGDVTLERPMGSAVIKTNFGHEQILTVFRARIFTGSLFSGTRAREIGTYATIYLVSIYDVSTGDMWEELVYPKTAGQSARADRQHGLYETNLDANFEDYTAASNDRFYFEEANDTLFFGNRRTGLLAYFPATFKGTRVQQVDGHDRLDWQFRGPSESSLIVPAVAADGLFADAFAYLTSAEFPKPTDVAVLLGRMVYVTGRTAWFADVGRPTSIAADNFIEIPAENELVAVEELAGNLMFFTENETYFYQPSTGYIISGGHLVRVSDTVGAVNPNAVAKVGAAVVFLDRQGIYASETGLDVAKLSGEDLAPFWRSEVSNPLTSYYQQAGFTSLAAAQPAMLHRFDRDAAHVVYDHVRDALFCVFPDQNFALVRSEQKAWHAWTFESLAAAANNVRVSTTLRNPFLLMGDRELYLVGGVETVTATDATLIGGNPSGEAPDVGSWYLLRYGCGGGLDRSVERESEDVRRIAGKVYSGTATMTGATGVSSVYIGEWVKVPTGYAFPAGGLATARTYLLPVELAPEPPGAATAERAQAIRLTFRFDNTHWQPVLRGSTSEIDFLLPPERLESAPGYSQGAPVAGTSEVQVYNSATGLSDPTGDEVRLRWDGSVVGYTGPYAPGMNLTFRQRNRLLWLPFRYSGLVTANVLQMGIVGILAEVECIVGAGPWLTSCDFYYWQQAQWNSRHSADDVAQAVDWLWKTGQIGIRGAVQVMFRTLYLKISSRGSAETHVQPSAVFGLLNFLFGPDSKDWTSQVVDYAGALSDVRNANSLRSRLRVAGAMTTRRFNGSATWANPANAAHGNYLIDDEQLDTIAVSDRVRGEHVSLMAFGHIRNGAERLTFDSAQAVVRAVAGRRRVGR